MYYRVEDLKYITEVLVGIVLNLFNYPLVSFIIIYLPTSPSSYIVYTSFIYATSLVTMARMKIDLERYRDDLTYLFQRGTSAWHLGRYMLHEYNVVVSERSIQRRLSIWGVTVRNNLHPEDRNRIKEIILEYFFKGAASDDYLLLILQDKEFDIKISLVRTLRREAGLLRRVEQYRFVERFQAALDILKLEMEQGRILSYGRGHAHTYMKLQGHNFPR
jgi:hypothetical protein